jgi:hypothetical protein
MEYVKYRSSMTSLTWTVHISFKLVNKRRLLYSYFECKLIDDRILATICFHRPDDLPFTPYYVGTLIL